MRRSRSALDPAAPALAIVAESAWISVVAALVQAFVQERAILGVVGLVPFVAAGLLIARAFGARLGSRWPATAVALTLVSAAAGWLVSPTVREALVGGDLSRALDDHADGWLAGLAMLRGFAHAGPLRSEESLAGLLGIGTPALAGVALLGGAVAEPWRGWFIADAIAGVILFLGTGILGLTIARMSSLGIASGFDWRRNRTWFALLLFLVVAIAGIALPGAFVVGAAIPIAVGLLAVPLLVVGVIAGFGLHLAPRARLGLPARDRDHRDRRDRRRDPDPGHAARTDRGRRRPGHEPGARRGGSGRDRAPARRPRDPHPGATLDARDPGPGRERRARGAHDRLRRTRATGTAAAAWTGAQAATRSDRSRRRVRCARRGPCDSRRRRAL